ncbi:MAG TPA: host attachment family protein [Allosphingosinicella sp.]|jgi:protein required for attachment to host cells
MRLPHNSFVVVADGEKMLFFRNEGDSEFPQLVVERNREQENPKDSDQKTDEAGRSHAGAGPGGNSYGETDFHKLEKDRFAHETADMLKRWALRNDFEQLVVVAPPKTLGELRKHYHKEVEKRLVGEIPKDLTNMPVPDIEKALLAH